MTIPLENIALDAAKRIADEEFSDYGQEAWDEAVDRIQLQVIEALRRQPEPIKMIHVSDVPPGSIAFVHATERDQLQLQWTGMKSELVLCKAALERINGHRDLLLTALRFYANPAIYKPHPHGPAFDRHDFSQTAKAAIFAVTGEEG